MKRLFLSALCLILIVLAIYPIKGTGYGVRFMLQLFMWIALAQSWNLISGLTGYVSFGHIAFFGMGAYTAGILIVKLGWPWLAASLAGGVGAVVLALVIGWPCLRLKGPYFAIAMLGLNEVLRVAVSYFEGLTGGGSGLSLPALYASVPIYYAMGLVALAVTGLAYVIVTSRFGLRLMTIREDEVAAEAMGIDTFRYKLYAFLLSAVGPGIVGGLAARDQSYIEPISVFPLIMTITMIVMVLFGGKGTIWGPVLGAVLLFTLQEMIWARFIYLHQLLFGAIIITVVLTGVEAIDGGEIRFKGRRIDGLKPHQVFHQGIGRTFQVIRVFPELTALENLLVVTTNDYATARARAEELLGFVKLTGLAGEFAGNLSYGQQKLVEFVRVLMTDPELILLDETAAGVNRTLLNDLLEAVRTLRDRGKTVLLVEHDMKMVMGLCETVFVLDHGEKLAEGPPGLIQADERVIEAYFGR